ncbi:MAG TPA: AarF/UbiB family protein, partial [Nocardioides sp.]|nr:AarF/UbiB family protein [Nocardioides sp.]
WLDGAPTAAASIGQVHEGRWYDGRRVAVKVQYPNAGDALMADLRTLARAARAIGPLIPGVDMKPLVEEVQARAREELDYELEADAQRQFAAEFRDDPHIVVPDVVAVGPRVLITEWLDSTSSLAAIIADGTQEERDHYGEIFTRFLFSGPARTGLLHADPHPGNFRIVPGEDGGLGKIGVLDFGAVARLPQRGLPAPMGRLITLCAAGDGDHLIEGLREEGFLKDRIRIEPQLLMDYLAPFVDPTLVERFRFSREWMREQFQRLNNPRDPAYTVSIKLNLPPSYVLIHRTWLGGVGVLSQLEAEAPFRAIMEEFLPGFEPPVAA